MSETIHDEQHTEDPETGLLHRVFAAEIATGEGRTIDVRVVPYGEVIAHNDGKGGDARGVVYRERWVNGAFSDQVRAAEVGRAKKVLVNFEHEQFGLAGVIGHGTALVERADGLYGSFVLHEGDEGDRALMLVREGIADGISLEAKPLKSTRTREGIVNRVKGHLVNVAICRSPAFKGARVLAMREEPIAEEPVLDEELLPIAPDPELLERCRALGIQLPQRYQAHPDPTDTPAEAGTSDDGTRHTDGNHEDTEE